MRIRYGPVPSPSVVDKEGFDTTTKKVRKETTKNDEETGLGPRLKRPRLTGRFENHTVREFTTKKITPTPFEYI